MVTEQKLFSTSLDLILTNLYLNAVIIWLLLVLQDDIPSRSSVDLAAEPLQLVQLLQGQGQLRLRLLQLRDARHCADDYKEKEGQVPLSEICLIAYFD